MTLSVTQVPLTTALRVGMIGLLGKSRRRLDLWTTMKTKLWITQSPTLIIALPITMLSGRTSFGSRTINILWLRCLTPTLFLRNSKITSNNTLLGGLFTRASSTLGAITDGERPSLESLKSATLRAIPILLETRVSVPTLPKHTSPLSRSFRWSQLAKFTSSKRITPKSAEFASLKSEWCKFQEYKIWSKRAKG